MSRSLRYQNPTIINHLASQYVSGDMTPRVRQRVDRLMLEIPAMAESIGQWQDAFSELHEHLDSPAFTKQQQAKVWARINAKTQLQSNKPTVSGLARVRAWINQRWWASFSLGAASVAMVLLIIPFVLQQTPQSTLSPAYVASMSPVDAEGSTLAPVYVVSVYKGNDGQRPQLVTQWVKNMADEAISQQAKGQVLHLWSEDKETQTLRYLGTQPKANEPFTLDKAAWQAIVNSHRLLVTNSASIQSTKTPLFTGLCLQLQSWKA